MLVQHSINCIDIFTALYGNLYAKYLIKKDVIHILFDIEINVV